MRFAELLERWEATRLSHGEAAAALGVSERTVRRWRRRSAEDGAAGLVDRRVGRPSPRRAPEDELERMRALYQQDYQASPSSTATRSSSSATEVRNQVKKRAAAAFNAENGLGHVLQLQADLTNSAASPRRTSSGRR